MSTINPQIDSSWAKALRTEFEAPYFKALKDFLLQEKKTAKVYPPGSRVFAAFNHTPFNAVKVVIIGQDPYHGPGQANGLAFSVADGVKIPPSLINIFKELETDLHLPMPKSGNLEPWADQGVLLLNATLTVRENEAGSHHNKGWERFTDAAIKAVSDHKKGIVFLLWGRFAQAKEVFIEASKHHVLKAAHPSPLARGAFFGCKHFSKTNAILRKEGLSEINWKLD